MDSNIGSKGVGSLGNATIKSGFSGWRNISSGSSTYGIHKDSTPIQLEDVTIDDVDVSSETDEKKSDFAKGFWESFLTSGKNPDQTFVSWFGVENKAGAAWLNWVAEAIKKGVNPKEYAKKKAEGWNWIDSINNKTKQGKIGKGKEKTEAKNAKIKDKYGDKNGWNDDYSFQKDNDLAAINFASVSASAEASLLKANWGVSGNAGSLDLECKVGYAEASATASIGPTHAGLEVGAAVGVFKGSYDARLSPLDSLLGYEVVALESSGTVTLLEASAKAKAGVGWYKDENGKMCFEAGAQLKAEAVVFKAEGSVGVDLLGVKGNLTGAVKFGVGAKLDAGVVNGKINFKIGVSLGLGFEIGGSIDASGFTGKIFSAAQTATNTEGNFFTKAGAFFGSLFNSYKHEDKKTTAGGDVSFLNASASAGNISVSGSTDANGKRTVTKTDIYGNTTVNGQPNG